MGAYDCCLIFTAIAASAASIIAVLIMWHGFCKKWFFHRARGRITDVQHHPESGYSDTTVQFQDEEGVTVDFREKIELTEGLWYERTGRVAVVYPAFDSSQAEICGRRHRKELRLAIMLGCSAVITMLTFGMLFWHMAAVVLDGPTPRLPGMF